MSALDPNDPTRQPKAEGTPSELAQLTEELLNLISSTGIPIVRVSGDLCIRRYTKNAEKYFQLVSRDIGRFIGEVHPTFDVPDLPRIIRNVIGDLAPYEREVQDRHRRWHLLRIAPYRTSDNGVDGAVLMLFDIHTTKTDAVLREKTIGDAERAARMELEAANRTKDHFLAMLSHELRNPLNSVLGWTRVLKSQPELKSQKLQEALDSIESAARSQARMISDLLDISRIASGKVQLDLKRMNLQDVVDKAVQQFVPLAQAKRIQIVRRYQGDEMAVLLDPERIAQVVSNLLSNAVKFTPEGGKVEVELKDEGHSAEIIVRDTGPGFPPDFQNHLFETFRQAEGSPTKAGLGLGLAIVKHLVALHGGAVEARNCSDRGAEFRVTLPCSDSRFPDYPAEPHQPALTNADGLDLTGLRVLIVDDDPDACALARRIFEDHKMKVFIALSAHEGLNLLKHHRPDVIVSDIGMPDQDGYELMKQIRRLPEAQGGKIPAIALTAFARSEDRKQALAVGYQKHLAKPVDPLELLTVIATLTSHRKR